MGNLNYGEGKKKNFKKEKMTINGFQYTEEEILEALRKKGYLILKYRTYDEKQTEKTLYLNVFEKEIKQHLKELI